VQKPIDKILVVDNFKIDRKSDTSHQKSLNTKIVHFKLKPLGVLNILKNRVGDRMKEGFRIFQIFLLIWA